MQIYSIKINNFKSIREEHNEIILDPTTTAIIGRNESGKSNILSGIAGISFTQRTPKVFESNNVNRNSTNNAKISYTIVLKSSANEIELIKEDTIIEIFSDSLCVYGGLRSYFDANLKMKLDVFTEMLKKNPFRFTSKDLAIVSQKRYALDMTDKLDIPSVADALSHFSIWSKNVSEDQRDEYNRLFAEVREAWNLLVSMLPSIFRSNDSRTLQPEYRGEAIKKELDNKNSLFSQMMSYIGFTKDQILLAASGSVEGEVENLQDKIQEAIDEKINKPFHDFYTTEIVNLKIRFTTNVISLSVKADGGSRMKLDERSNGLKWYLNMFVDSIMHEIPSRNVVYLFDEPGISLHVNAQRELLSLFDDLTKKGNQVVYTTHSPFMLNTQEERLGQIRAVVKDESENTKIYNSVFDPEISPAYQKDTLAPVWSAIGANMQDMLSIEHILHKAESGLFDYPEALEQYRNAIAKYSAGVYERNVLDDMRLSLELLLKKILKNDLSLENQKNVVGSFMKNAGISIEVRNMIIEMISYYCRYQNEHVKHNSKINPGEIEYVIEQTSIIMKLLIKMKEKSRA